MLTNITASPIVLMKCTGGDATSRARPDNRLARFSSSSGGTASPNRVKSTRSAKHTVTSRAPGSFPGRPLRDADRLGLEAMTKLQPQHALGQRSEERRSSLHQFAIRLGDLQFRRAGLDHRLKHHLPHHLGGLRHPVSEDARHGDQLLAGESDVDEHLCLRRGLGIGPQMNRRVGIVDPRQAECPLHRLEQFHVDAGVLADLSR